MRGLGGAALLLAFIAPGCADLPNIPTGVCGNGIVETPEDCDTFAPHRGSVCRPKGASGACHLDCQRRSDGSRPSCPAGWGCDGENLCREPTGSFSPASEFAVGGASMLLAGDFDGDGRAEVISEQPRDALERTHLRFHYFDEQGTLAETRIFPKLLASPVMTDVNGDHRGDLVFSDFRVGVLPGRADRAWVPETFHSYVLPDAGVRMLSVYDDPIENDSALLALTTVGGVSGLYVPDSATGRLLLRGKLPGPVEDLAGSPVSGDLIGGEDSPCREVVLARRGADTFFLLDLCARDPVTARIVWRARATQSTIALDPPAPIDRTPELCDLNGDGHLDALLGASGRPYVSYGDGHGLATAIPYRLALANPLEVAPDIAVPLAAGDFTGDGVADFVLDDRILVSSSATGGTLPSYVVEHSNSGARWTVATIADLNGNGKPDVVAASNAGPGIDFFNGTGTQHVIASSLPTTGPIQLLAVGDFDGDLTNDLASIEAGGEDGDSLTIAYGSVGALLSQPVQVARVRNAQELSVYRESGIAHLTVASEEGTAGHESGTLTLLDGSPDRLPFAPYGLTTVSSDGVLEGSNAVAVTVGAFTAPGGHEVLALGTRGFSQPFDFWLGSTLEAAGNTPRRLSEMLDPRLEPSFLAGDEQRLTIASASADLDGDGRDEALWVMSADARQRCGLSIFDATRDGGGRLSARGTVIIDRPCLSPQLSAVDADGDGSVDVALLTGSEGDPDRQLLVLWNDGTGSFSTESTTLVSGSDDSPRSFTTLPATPARPFGFVYVTRGAAVLALQTGTSREFEPPRLLTALAEGSGVVAADVNGDGVLDLAISDAGNLDVLAARLKVP